MMGKNDKICVGREKGREKERKRKMRGTREHRLHSTGNVIPGLPYTLPSHCFFVSLGND